MEPWYRELLSIRCTRVMNYDFDLKRMTSFEGDTGKPLPERYPH